MPKRKALFTIDRAMMWAIVVEISKSYDPKFFVRLIAKKNKTCLI